MSTVDLQDLDDLFADVVGEGITSVEFERRVSKLIDEVSNESYEEGWQEGHSIGYEEGMNERDFDGD